MLKVTLCRSEEWVAGRRLETGTNVPMEMQVQVDPAELSMNSRGILLEIGGGEYPSAISGLHYNAEYCLHSARFGYGHQWFMVDGGSPSVQEIDAAIQDAYHRFVATREKWLAEEARRKAADEEKAAIEAEREAARELLAEEIGDLKESVRQIAQKRDMLVRFLVHVPGDAKRGALHSLARAETESTVADLRTAIENASPKWIFDDNDDDE